MKKVDDYIEGKIRKDPDFKSRYDSIMQKVALGPLNGKNISFVLNYL